MNYMQVETLIGTVTLIEENEALTAMLFAGEAVPADAVKETTPLLTRAAGELHEYFDGTRREFDLPLAPAGTAFQQRVWQALREIPFGETRSYKEISVAADCPKGYRAVGMANNRNPLPIFIPCHRVIGANGELIGYAGGVGVKEILLRLESTSFT